MKAEFDFVNKSDVNFSVTFDKRKVELTINSEEDVCSLSLSVSDFLKFLEFFNDQKDLEKEKRIKDRGPIVLGQGFLPSTEDEKVFGV